MPARKLVTTRRTPPEPSHLISTSELGRLISRSRASIRCDVAAGRIPAPVKICRVTLWRRTDIEAWIAAGCPPVRQTPCPR